MPISLRGYHPPEPPFMCVDDIRPAIPWFEEDNNEDEFDWLAVDEDLKDNVSTIMAQGLSATTSKTYFIKLASSPDKNPTSCSVTKTI